MVAIIGQQARASLGADYQQEVDLVSLYKDVARELVQVLNVPAQMDLLVDRALRVAAASRSVTAIIVPNDVQELEYEEPSRTHGEVYSSVGYARPRTVPERTELESAAELLNAGTKVAMLIGQGAIGAAVEVCQAAELLGCGVAKALNGKAALADDLPYVTGGIGLLGTKPSYDMMEGCDTLLMVGTSYTPRLHPSDFRTRSQDGVGADWPIAYAELRPHYERVERMLFDGVLSPEDGALAPRPEPARAWARAQAGGRRALRGRLIENHVQSSDRGNACVLQSVVIYKHLGETHMDEPSIHGDNRVVTTLSPQSETDTNRSGVAVVADSVVSLLRTVRRAKARLIAAASDDVESASQLLLRTLAADGPTRASALAASVHSDLSTVSRQVAGLVANGLLERRADPVDGRASLLVVTDAGQAVIAEHEHVRTAFFTQVLDGWNDAELTQFSSLLERFTAAYEQTHATGWPPGSRIGMPTPSHRLAPAA